MNIGVLSSFATQNTEQYGYWRGASVTSMGIASNLGRSQAALPYGSAQR